MRVSNRTRGLLAQIEKRHDEPLDALIFYMALEELNVDAVSLTAMLDHRRGCAPDYRAVGNGQ